MTAHNLRRSKRQPHEPIACYPKITANLIEDQTVYTPGPWISARFETGEYYTYQISTAAGHIASVVGWTNFGGTCLTTEANARLIAHAPDLVTALQSLIAWADTMGGWEAACWERARRALVSALGGEDYEHLRPKSERSDSPRLPRSQRHDIRLLRRD